MTEEKKEKELPTIEWDQSPFESMQVVNPTTNEEILNSLLDASKNINMKTNLVNPIYMAIMENESDFLTERGLIRSGARYKKLATSIKELMNSKEGFLIEKIIQGVTGLSQGESRGTAPIIVNSLEEKKKKRFRR